jgi:hypothetical protein
MIPLHSFRRGEQITADQLNVILDSIRRNTLTDGSGYTLNRTPYGTSLRINQTVATGGGGGGGASAVCKWRVEDISEPGEGGKLHLKIRVHVDELKDVNRWPTGTSDEQKYIDIDLGNNRTAGWAGVYLRIDVNQKNVPLEGDAGINIHEMNGWAQENSVAQITYIAGVTISDDNDGNPYISFIDNYCPSPYVKPAPTCPFLIEDYGLGLTVDPKISIRSTPVQRHYPTGMNDTDTYVLTIPETQQWFAVYAVLVTDKYGFIQFGTNDVTLSLETTYKTSTETITYFLLGEVNVGYDENSNRVIDFIYNVCQTPFITGAININGEVIPRGSTIRCDFRTFDASTNTIARVEVTQQPVLAPNARWPEGMGLGYPPFYLTITQPSYIYIKYVYVDNDVIVSPESYAITIAISPTPFLNTVNEEYSLIAIVDFDGEKITKVSNNCPLNYPQPCRLNWSASPEPPPGNEPEPPPETP